MIQPVIPPLEDKTTLLNKETLEAISRARNRAYFLAKSELEAEGDLARRDLHVESQAEEIADLVLFSEGYANKIWDAQWPHLASDCMTEEFKDVLWKDIKHLVESVYAARFKGSCMGTIELTENSINVRYHLPHATLI